jgi:hypothetical protein
MNDTGVQILGKTNYTYLKTTSILMKKISSSNWFIIGVLILSTSILNIIRVIMGAFQTPPGQTYLAIGHSYLDYLEYTQQIAQGIYGHTSVANQFTTNDPTQTIIGWGQYLLIGYIAKFFHASPFLAYWVAVFILSVGVLFVSFVLIRKILNTQPFSYQLTAFLFSIFAVPFITLSFHPLTITPIEFFYSPISLFHRLGGVPHHLMTTLCISISILLSSSILQNGILKKWRTFYTKLVLFILLSLTLLTFAPLQIFSLLSAVGTTICFYIWWNFHLHKQSSDLKPLFIFLVMLSITVLPAALFIKSIHGSQELFVRAIAWERTQQYHATLLELLGTLGPILFLVPFGIRAYFKSLTPLKLILFLFVAFSYLYFSTDLAYFFGTFNQRLLTPLSYILFAILSIYGLRSITTRFPYRSLLSTGIISLYLFYFTVITILILKSFGGSDALGYMPNDFFTGIKMLNQQSDSKAVLTSSYKNLGILIPSVVDRNVYVGRIIFTPDYPQKQNTADQFYAGNMNEKEAYQFLQTNNIGYIIVSSIEPYPKENMLKYPFISEIYENSFLTILQFHE